MKKISQILLCSLLFLSYILVSSAFARTATKTELQELQTRASTYREATVTNNVNLLLEGIAPKVIDILTKITKSDKGEPVTVDLVKNNIRRDISEFTSAVKIVDWQLNLAKKHANELSDGTPFFVIPVKSIVELKVQKRGFGDKIVTESHRQQIDADMLAVLDGGKWYFLSADNPMQLMVYEKAFPGIQKVHLRKPKIKNAP